MVKIRLRRTGAKKKPNYRVVVADSRAPRDGRFIEIIGHYNPRTSPSTVVIHEDRALYWLSVGAQPTESVNKMLTNIGTLDKLSKVKAGVSIEQVLSDAPMEQTPEDSDEIIVPEAKDSKAEGLAEEVVALAEGSDEV
jgi:small subunit ribosomal protein S16